MKIRDSYGKELSRGYGKNIGEMKICNVPLHVLAIEVELTVLFKQTSKVFAASVSDYERLLNGNCSLLSVLQVELLFSIFPLHLLTIS